MHVAARAVNGEGSGGVRDGGLRALVGVDYSWDGLSQVQNVAAVEREVPDLPVRDHVGALARFGLDLQLARVCLNLDRLGHLPDFEREVARVELVQRAQNDVALLDPLEALFLDADRVRAGRQLWRDEDSVGVRGRSPSDAVGRIGDSDGRACYCRAVAVFDVPGDRAVTLPEGDAGEHDYYRGRRPELNGSNAFHGVLPPKTYRRLSNLRMVRLMNRSFTIKRPVMKPPPPWTTYGTGRAAIFIGSGRRQGLRKGLSRRRSSINTSLRSSQLFFCSVISHAGG